MRSLFPLECRFQPPVRAPKVFPWQIFLSGSVRPRLSCGWKGIVGISVRALNLPNWCWECKSNPIIGNVGPQPLWGKILETLMVICWCLPPSPPPTLPSPPSPPPLLYLCVVISTGEPGHGRPSERSARSGPFFFFPSSLRLPAGIIGPSEIFFFLPPLRGNRRPKHAEHGGSGVTTFTSQIVDFSLGRADRRADFAFSCMFDSWFATFQRQQPYF